MSYLNIRANDPRCTFCDGLHQGDALLPDLDIIKYDNLIKTYHFYRIISKE